MTRVLLVEDDRGIADFVQRGLRAEGYTVTWCASAREGDQAVSDDTDVVILDLGLPDGDGMQLCAAWHQTHPELPVLILSARDAVESRVAGLDAGAEDYLTKPFAFDELLARLRVLVRRRDRDGDGEAVVRAGGLVLQPANRMLEFDGQYLTLTDRECLLLEYLMRRAGHAVTRRQILEHAWAAEDDVSENAVDVYISYLRRKLDNRRTRLIQTVHGLGYRFQPPE